MRCRRVDDRHHSRMTVLLSAHRGDRKKSRNHFWIPRRNRDGLTRACGQRDSASPHRSNVNMAGQIIRQKMPEQAKTAGSNLPRDCRYDNGAGA